MTGKMTLLPATLLVFGSTMAVAQTPSLKQGNGDGPASDHFASFEKALTQVITNPRQMEAQTAMYEDIEILRRLLSSNLQKLYPSRAGEGRNPTLWFNRLPQGIPGEGLRNAAPLDSTSTVNQYSWLLDQIPGPDRNVIENWIGVFGPYLRVVDIEGSYLSGYGVLYMVTLPPPQGKPKTDSATPQPNPLTDWERIRKQLHGENVPDEGQKIPAQTKEPSLTGVILKTLFENGHHFVRLNENEKLTVAITFRPAEQRGNQGMAANSDGNPLASGTRSVAVGVNPDGTIRTLGSSQVVYTAIGNATKTPSSAHDYLLLGDLHMRQGQGNDALNAYRRALNDLSRESGGNNTLGQLRELHQKVAQAYLSMGDLENARKEFDELDKLQKRQAVKRDSSAKPGEARLPAKLMISAPKKLLEQAGAGKLSFEEFKKGVTVEELNFSKPNAASPSSGVAN